MTAGQLEENIKRVIEGGFAEKISLLRGKRDNKGHGGIRKVNFVGNLLEKAKRVRCA